jgi:hypothetical protein
MVGARVLVEDTGDEEVTLEAAAALPRAGVEDGAVEFLSDVKPQFGMS